ncbi:MAG: SH3 domain-containing protein [Firmicutes bacterium]|nr:SH3 domain-containing protein [Bacillota bacterium]
MKKMNLFAKLGIATTCVFGGIAPVMTAMTPIHANDGMNTVNFSVTQQYKTLITCCDTDVCFEPSDNARVYHTLPAGTVVQTEGVTNNGWYSVITTDPKNGGETSGYIRGTQLSDLYEGITFTTSVDHGFLALRSEKAFDDRNIVGKLYNGCKVESIGRDENGYILVKVVSVSKNTDKNLVGKTGYVNSNYLL